MRTDELIDQLANRPPHRATSVSARLALAASLGVAGAVTMLLIRLNIRPDLVQAAETATFWMKVSYGAVISVAGFLALERLSRPAGSGRRGMALALVAFLVLAALGAAQLAATPPDDRLAVWLGRSWRKCPTNVLTLALPMLAVALFAVRTLAPTRLVLAGGATGLFSGGVAMTAYCLHCPETAPAFVATWYTLGAVLTAAVGAILGPLVLRWR